MAHHESDGVDEVLSVLADANRRAVLSALRTRGESVSVAELATAVDGEHDERVATRLRHTDLPKLAAVGLVSFDPDAGTVEPTDGITDVAPLLDAIQDVRGTRPPAVFRATMEPTIRSQRFMAECYIKRLEKQLASLGG